MGGRWVGDEFPVYVVAEIGINHNGSLETAKQLIDAAHRAGCDAVKFQKRTPELCVPPAQRDRLRETPWGDMTYLEYRHRMELGKDDYQEIDRYCDERGITWFASCWDVPSVEFIDRFDPPCHKVSSASVTDVHLLDAVRRTMRPVLLSTGMSTMAEIDGAIERLAAEHLIVNHCTSTYPCQPAELNLRMIETLRERLDVPIGYSGHEAGLVTTVAAVALGARLVERHITLDRAMWGSDQAASIEPRGFERLVQYIRVVETAMGSGRKEVYESERPAIERLRNATAVSATASRKSIPDGRV
jgi:N-acetylneuraminate synthase